MEGCEQDDTCKSIVPWEFASVYVDPRSLKERRVAIDGVEVVLEQRPGDHINVHRNTGLFLWDACFVLAKYLEDEETTRRKGTLSGKRCLDLGAGLGLLALSALVLGAANVVATDIEETLQLLDKNISRNEANIREASKVIKIGILTHLSVFHNSSIIG
eukprot:m.134336 g.134336  ORF g.134336 m.134336 type:complete len:159 (+) comp14692_c0_seq6:185-661(+)